MTAKANTETMGFQTEAKKLLHLMIHSHSTRTRKFSSVS